MSLFPEKVEYSLMTIAAVYLGK